MNENKKKIIELREKINQWNKEYFINNNPSVSDRVYDSSLKLLIELENKYPEFNDPNSPTNIIGDFSLNKFKKIKHNKKMLSLAKAYSVDDIKKFISDIKKITQEDSFFYIEPKIDGLSISLKYKNGKLVQASTRGDGVIGEDVTDNVYNVISDIPTKIKNLNELEIRGEIYISDQSFKEIIKSGEVFANPRNAASGTLRQLNKEIVKKRNLSCLVYEIVNFKSLNFNGFNETIEFLDDLGFKTQKNNFFSNKEEDIISFISNFKNNNKLDYEIDGLVVKLNNLNFQDELGYTSKFPKYNIAFKFDDEITKTNIKDIFVTIGRTGNVTYNASFEKVLLKGSFVSAATLHNYEYIKSLNLNIGDEVEIKKAGEIIPKVIKVTKKNSQDVFHIIDKCPFCLSNLIFNGSQLEQYCPNLKCDERRVRQIIHFVSRNALDISFLGEKWIRIFFDKKIIENISDVFLIPSKKEEIFTLKRIGEKSFNNLLKSIESCFQIDLPKLLFSLGIEKMGIRNSYLIAKKIKKFENILNFNFDSLIDIKDIGPLTIKSLKDFLDNEDNKHEIEKLIKIGINPSFSNEEQESIISSPFLNKKIAITGSFEIERENIIKILNKLGAIYTTSISKNTDFLLCGENAGSKLNKAQSLEIKIISLNELNKFN
ncbi:MAG: NAD-dependent DNA ligase LigA [Metamycoplasmataceae bacterium]